MHSTCIPQYTSASHAASRTAAVQHLAHHTVVLVLTPSAPTMTTRPLSAIVRTVCMLEWRRHIHDGNAVMMKLVARLQHIVQYMYHYAAAVASQYA
eukprot:5579-Heterococcus_DN1.PRE.5